MTGAEITSLVTTLRSEDKTEAESVVDDLISHGEAAVQPVTGVLADGPVHSRAAAAWILGSIGDAAAADALWAALDDPDEAVRGRAAAALSWLSDPRAVDALVRALEDAQDVLHAFHTLAAVELVGHGPEVVLRLVAELGRREPYGQMVILNTLGRIAYGAADDNPAMARLAEVLDSFDPADSDEGREDLVARVQEWAGHHIQGG